MSLSLIAGTLTWTPGRLMPLWLLTWPPTSTLVVTSVSETSVVRSRIRPSSMRISSPGFTSPGSPAYVVEHRSASPATSSVVMVNVAPSARTTGPSAKVPSRIFGPCRSARIAMALPISALARRTCA